MMRIAQAEELHQIMTLICNITADIKNGFLPKPNAVPAGILVWNSFIYRLQPVSGRLCQIAQYIMQHATIFDIFDFHRSIDPAFQRDLFDATIHPDDSTGHLLQRLNRIQTTD